MKITEQKLLKLTSTLLMDFFQTPLDFGSCTCEIEDMTIADIQEYCRDWIKQNVNYEANDDQI